MNCFIVPIHEKFANVINDEIVCVSKHKDYTSYHWKRRDLALLKKHDIAKFVIVDRAGAIEEIIATSDLALRGHNFATAKRSEPVLIDGEADELVRAVELVAKRKESMLIAAEAAAGQAAPEGATASAESTSPAASETSSTVEHGDGSQASGQAEGPSNMSTPAEAASGDVQDDQVGEGSEVQSGCEEGAPSEAAASKKKRRR